MGDTEKKICHQQRFIFEFQNVFYLLYYFINRMILSWLFFLPCIFICPLFNVNRTLVHISFLNIMAIWQYVGCRIISNIWACAISEMIFDSQIVQNETHTHTHARSLSRSNSVRSIYCFRHYVYVMSIKWKRDHRILCHCASEQDELKATEKILKFRLNELRGFRI